MNKVVNHTLEDDKEVTDTAPPSLSRQMNVRGALVPGAFPVSIRGHRNHDHAYTSDEDSSLSVVDEEQPSSTADYLAEATAVTDGSINQEVYEGRVIMPNDLGNDGKEERHHPVCSRRTIFLVVIAVFITGALVGFATYKVFDNLSLNSKASQQQQQQPSEPPQGNHMDQRSGDGNYGGDGGGKEGH